MKVVITSATEKEILLIKELLVSADLPSQSPLEVQFHISGVGILASCFSISQLIFTQKPDLIIQAGIAGTFGKADLGRVIVVENEYAGDAGVIENGIFKDLFDLKLQDENEQPFINRKLSNPQITKWNITNLPVVDGITINTITTHEKSINEMMEKYGAAIESMEGASLHYCCLKCGVPFIQMRAISNYVGERNKSLWVFAEAFKNLSDSVLAYVEQLKILQEKI